MERVSHIQKQPSDQVIAIQFPRYIILTAFVLVVVILTASAIIAATHQPLSDPFSIYGDLLGTSVRPAIAELGFVCQSGHAPAGYCSLRIPHPFFAQVGLRMARGTVTEVSFSIRDKMLALGDLAARWGRPEIWLYCETFVAS